MAVLPANTLLTTLQDSWPAELPMSFTATFPWTETQHLVLISADLTHFALVTTED